MLPGVKIPDLGRMKFDLASGWEFGHLKVVILIVLLQAPLFAASIYRSPYFLLSVITVKPNHEKK